MKPHGAVSRRSFLKKTSVAASALALPSIIPASALGKDGRAAPSERIVMGAIGTGGRGTWMLNAFLNTEVDGREDAQVEAVCDVDASRRARAREIVDKHYNTGSCMEYNEFEELLGREDIDAVTVCTPDHWHALIAVAAAKAGKDIYCEKPLANTVAEGRAVCNAVERYGRVLQTGSHERSRHSVRFACELIRNGRIGQLRTIRVHMPCTHKPVPVQPVMPVPAEFDYERWLGPAPWAAYTQLRCHGRFRMILDYSGGEMTDRGAHVLDIAQLINDADDSGPTRIKGEGWAPREGLYNTFMDYDFECEYENGVRLIGDQKGKRGLKFEGDEGWIFVEIHGGALEAEPASLLRETILPHEFRLSRSESHQRDFLDAVRERRQPAARAEVGHRTGSLCHLINIAMLTGDELKWDPVREQVTNSDRANRMLSRPMRSPWTL